MQTEESKVNNALKRWASSKPDVYLCRVVMAGARGTPDFLLCVAGIFVAVECKSKKGKLSAMQSHTLHNIAESGGLVVVPHSADEAYTALDEIYNAIKGQENG